MILQYKGFNDNWCYEQSNTIVYSKVYVGEITKSFQDGGQFSYNLKDIEKSPIEIGESAEGIALNRVKMMHESVDKFIKEKTNCADEIVYLIGDKRFDEMENICVVTLKDKNKYVTYVFDNGVYILNDSGGTVQRIA